MKCRICEMEIPDSANYCQVCGSRQTLTHCINCGTAVTPDACYCPNCGIKIYKPQQDRQPKKKQRIDLSTPICFIVFLLLLYFLLKYFQVI